MPLKSNQWHSVWQVPHFYSWFGAGINKVPVNPKEEEKKPTQGLLGWLCGLAFERAPTLYKSPFVEIYIGL